jgi:hypothetical protein
MSTSYFSEFSPKTLRAFYERILGQTTLAPKSLRALTSQAKLEAESHIHLMKYENTEHASENTHWQEYDFSNWAHNDFVSFYTMHRNTSIKLFLLCEPYHKNNIRKRAHLTSIQALSNDKLLHNLCCCQVPLEPHPIHNTTTRQLIIIH